jgi:hypothetical protein
MIKFMYIDLLEEGVQTSDLLRLLKLADEYGVGKLRRACVSALSSKPADQ